MAILAIIALGVGLFAGLKVTQPFILETAEQYFAEKNLYDVHLITSYGFEDVDVETLSRQPEVRSIQGAYSYDALVTYGETQSTVVMKIHSLTEGINELELVTGRLPEAPDECVVDSRMYGEAVIGEKLFLTSENDEDTLENFAEREFTIVGAVRSPCYIQFERGNTSLGNGKISCFLYVPGEAFDSEVYTEVFVKLDKDLPLYSEEYDAYYEEQEEAWKVCLEQVAQDRYERVLREANEELADAKQEFYSEKADAEAELADAGKELADAEKELADAKTEIADAKVELARGEQELLEGETELREKEQELWEAEQELKDALNEWNKGSDQHNQGQWDLDAAKRALEEQEQLLLEQEQQLAAAEEAALQSAAGAGITAQTLEELQAGLELSLEAMRLDPTADAAVIRQLEEQLAGVETLIAGKEQAAAGRQQIAAGMQQIAAGQAELDFAHGELAYAITQIWNGQREIEDGRVQIADAWAEIEDSRRELAEARQEIADAEKELAEGEQEYLEGLEEYQDGLVEFEEEVADAEAEIADAEAEIADLEEPDSYVLGRNTNIGYACLDNDSGIVDRVAAVFPVFFVMVAALVCMTTMNRMIEEQRTQIGVLKALGYSNGAIMGKYLFYSGSAALTGCILGFFAGTLSLPYIIWAAYGSMYDMTGLVYYVDWPLAFLSLGASLLCSMGITWYSCRTELVQVAATLMRPKAPKAGKRVFLEYLPFIWRRLKFLQKVSVRNVLRYKKRFFMMLIGISGCTALLVAAFGILDSVKDVVNMQYEEIQTYDISLTFRKEPQEEVLAEYDALLEGKCESEDLFMETSLDLQWNGQTKSIYLVVPENPDTFDQYADLHTTRGAAVPFPGEGETVITHGLAENLGIQVNDEITFVDEDYNTFSVRVSGIAQNFINNYAFLHPDTCEKLWKEPEYQAAYVNVAEGAGDMHELAAELLDLEDIANVTVNVDTRERFGTMLSSLNVIVFVIILCAGALAFIVLYNLTNINITERIREIATIKVLGFYKKETATYVFRENLMLTTLGAAAGLLLGKAFHAFIMSCIRLDAVTFDVRVDRTSYLYSFLLTFVFAWLVNRFMTGKIERISMTESLKSVD